MAPTGNFLNYMAAANVLMNSAIPNFVKIRSPTVFLFADTNGQRNTAKLTGGNFKFPLQTPQKRIIKLITADPPHYSRYMNDSAQKVFKVDGDRSSVI
jgi:hypothetical protein